MTDTIETSARTVWNYMLLNQPLQRCDAIFVLGSRDERVAEYAAELYAGGYGKWLVVSGGVAHTSDMLRTSWGDETEAEHFGKIAISKGVSPQRLILENCATNTGENIRFTYDLLKENGMTFSSLLLVQKPYMERRTFATFKKQWPDAAAMFTVSSPPIPYDDYFDSQNPKEEILNIMTGDLQRIKVYPKLGYQIEQDIPADVWRAYERLVAAGYDKHLITTV